jgi:hypothetical protein
MIDCLHLIAGRRKCDNYPLQNQVLAISVVEKSMTLGCPFFNIGSTCISRVRFASTSQAFNRMYELPKLDLSRYLGFTM